MPSAPARNRPVWLPARRRSVPAALGNDPAAIVASFRPQINHPIRGLDDIHVVLDHDEGVVGIPQPHKHIHQSGHIMKVQTGRRFIQNE